MSAFELIGRRVFVAGHRGMVGSALMRRLRSESCEILTVGRNTVDLRRQAETEAWFEAARPQVVFVAAATVGGIYANASRPASFLYDNLAIASNVIEAARRTGVLKLLFLGSSCIYPKHAAQPISEDALLTGSLEPTNEWYAVAKIAGLKLCSAYRRQYGCNFVSAMPTNLYGPADNFDLATSHVLPALLAKVHRAKQDGTSSIEVWGTGAARRELMHVEDLADACVFLMKHYSGETHVNIGSGDEVTIRELAEMIATIVGWCGELVFNHEKPDGTPRKLLDVARLHAMGWRRHIPLAEGIRQTYAWFCAQEGSLRRSGLS